LGGLIQKNKFAGEDKVPVDGEEPMQEEGEGDSSSGGEVEEGEEDEQLQWEDVFPDGKS
jgi:hypothetical protein